VVDGTEYEELVVLLKELELVEDEETKLLDELLDNEDKVLEIVDCTTLLDVEDPVDE
jgi:hypothetical protein